MRFLSLYTPKNPPSGPPSPEHMAQMGAFMEESIKAGTLIMTGGLTRSAETGVIATLDQGKFDLKKGPFPESKLQMASGWAILQAKSREDLNVMIKKFLELAGDGECDIIQIMDMGD